MTPKFDCEDDIHEIKYISPWLLVVLADAIMWARAQHLSITITSLLRESGDGISQSTTHQEGRAIDLSVRRWSKDNISALSNYLNDKYAIKIGTAPAGMPPKVCKYHNSGAGWHFHLQVRRVISAKIQIV